MSRVVTKRTALLALAAFLAVPAYAQDQAPAGGPPVLAKQIAPSRAGTSRLLVTSTAFRSNDALPERYTQNGENVSPPIRWAKGPAGTQAYVVIAEDSGVNRPEPIVHWIIYDIPSTMTTLPAGIPAQPSLETGASQGKNVRGEYGYIGPKPPAGQTHPYHFQVFALNGKLRLDPATADRQTVLNAMRNKVITSGDLIVNYTGK